MNLHWRTVAAALVVIVAAVVVLGLAAIGGVLYYSDRGAPGARAGLGVQLLSAALISGALFVAQLATSYRSARSQRKLDLSLALGTQGGLPGADLRDEDFSGLFLRGRNFQAANLSWGRLASCDCTGTNFAGARLLRANCKETVLAAAHFLEADLRGLNGYAADLSRAVVVRADLRGARLRAAFAVGAEFSGSDLEGASLFGCRLMRATFAPSDGFPTRLRKARIRSVEALAADFSGADLTGARLGGSSFGPMPADMRTMMSNKLTTHRPFRQMLSVARREFLQEWFELPEVSAHQVFRVAGVERPFARTSFRGARLAFATCRRTDFQDVDFTAADLRKADLRRANVCGANFSGAQLGNTKFRGAKCDASTRWPKDFDWKAAGLVQGRARWRFIKGLQVPPRESDESSEPPRPRRTFLASQREVMRRAFESVRVRPSPSADESTGPDRSAPSVATGFDDVAGAARGRSSGAAGQSGDVGESGAQSRRTCGPADEQPSAGGPTKHQEKRRNQKRSRRRKR